MSADMSPVCYNCQQLYSESNPPRILPRCSHSFCEKCLSTLKSCPRDRTPIDPKQSLNINMLALNKALKEVEVNVRMCLLHNKPFDLICMDDAVSICSICALFGQHKHHAIKTDKEVMKESATMTESIVVSLNKIKRLDEKVGVQIVASEIQNKMSQKQMEMTKQVKEQYRKLVDKVRRAQTETVKKLRLMFSEKKTKIKGELSFEDLSKKRDEWVDRAESLLTLTEAEDFESNLDSIQKYINPNYSQHQLSRQGVKLTTDLQYFLEVYPQRLSKASEEIQYSVNSDVQTGIQRFLEVYQHQLPKSYLAESISTIRGYICDKKDDTNLLGQQSDILQELVNQDQLNSTYKSVALSQNLSAIKGLCTIKTRRNSLCKSVNQNSVLHQRSISRLDRSRRYKIPQKYLAIIEDLKHDRCEVIDLGGAELGDQIVTELCEYIQVSEKLRTIKLMRNKLTDDVIEPLVSACWNVNTINLGQNSMTNTALDILSEIDLKSLTSLVLSQNKLKERSCKQKISEFKKLGLHISL